MNVRLSGAISLLLCCGCAIGCTDGPAPAPNRLNAVQAACQACTAAQATHQCAPSQTGQRLCDGIPPARVGDTMIVCAQGLDFQNGGINNRIEWRSSDPQVATVTKARLTVTHCTAELDNAVVEAKSPGTAMIIADELAGSVVVRSASAPMIVTARVE